MTNPESLATYSSPLLNLPGAAEPQGGNEIPEYTGVAWHYGQPLVEQRYFERSGGFVDRSHRGVLCISGEDAAVFLNNLVSQKLIELPNPWAGEALDLDIQGHVVHHMEIIATDEVFYVHVPAAQLESLHTFFTRMIFWSKVTVEVIDAAVISVISAQHLDALVDAPLPEALAVSPVIDFSLPRRDILVPRTSLMAVAASSQERGFQPAGMMAYTAARVRSVQPVMSLDMDATTIPHEAASLIGRGDHIGAVHLNKGCYRGQETVGRVENLGRSPRVLVMVLIDGSAPEQPHPAAPLTAGGRTVGFLGTVVDDFELGPIGLAVVKRSALKSATLQAGDDVAISIDPDSLPHDDGEKAGRAAINKLRGL